MTTVLVVEDEVLIADDIQRTLVRLGYQVPSTVLSGESAIQATGELQPSLVLMDIKLRGRMDGIEAAAAIRERFDVPVVYLTSHSDEPTLARAMGTHPHGYLLKPFTDRELRTSIEVALDRHEMETKLAQRERWFSTTLRSIGDAVISTDRALSVTFMNPEAERITGWGQEALGRPITEVLRLTDDHGQPIASPVGLALERSKIVDLPENTELTVRSGQRVAVEDSAAPIVDDRGLILGGVVVFRDVSEKRDLEARVARSERMAALGTMAAGVAHEINNPLTFVLANLEAGSEGLRQAISALSGGPSDPLQRQVVAQLKDLEVLLTEAQGGADRVRDVVQELKIFGRTDRPTGAPIDPMGAAETAIKMTAHTVAHHARIQRALGPTPRVKAKEGTLVQVFSNLLLNAADAIGEGQATQNVITVRTSTDPRGWASIEIEDTGPGIPAGVLPRIFDPFFTTKAVGKGLGLGLAIAHHLITELGGQLSAHNQPGSGAVMRVCLPPAEAVAEPQRQTPESKSANPARRKVLVVDDELAITQVVDRLLRAQHQVTTCTRATDALALLNRGERFDLIFLDLMMPNMSGEELYHRLSALDPEQAQRVVFMTGGAFSHAAANFLAQIPNRRLYKPFSIETIRTLARELLE
ncbi:MAG: response regulator [Deltaproteobacteria bacterium]|nr:response regulator [Deltaproteobacteria bacterium]